MEVIKIIDHIWWEEKEEFLLAEDQDSFWVLYLLVEGECYYKIGEFSGIAKSPCVLICPPHTVFERKVLAPLSFHFFRLDVVPNQSYLNLSAGMHRLTKERLAMDQMFLKQYVYDLSGFSFFIRTHSIMDILLFSSISYQKPNKSIPPLQIHNSCIIDLLHYLDNHYQEDFSIQQLSEKYSFNASYLSRLFKKETGYSPKEYLLKVRLKNVQNLLISTNLPMEEIAELTGFKHGYYLSKYFKKIFKMSPSTFRKKHLL
ncbi:AraC family transcriptional regulator [Enterococcus durans]|uniref:helix-turn-helix domain-containing protein n=1 Tax=Enterococcus durans TaxID=53345 RepID=UPI001430D008|nr:AraC family transcriptional regulator [Enterococcus durans]NJE64340.1 AraC family transcriptional regulator [Enterococcus durans]